MTNPDPQTIIRNKTLERVVDDVVAAVKNLDSYEPMVAQIAQAVRDVLGI